MEGRKTFLGGEKVGRLITKAKEVMSYEMTEREEVTFFGKD